jgi:hypothetical protein
MKTLNPDNPLRNCLQRLFTTLLAPASIAILASTSVHSAILGTPGATQVEYPLGESGADFSTNFTDASGNNRNMLAGTPSGMSWTGGGIASGSAASLMIVDGRAKYIMDNAAGVSPDYQVTIFLQSSNTWGGDPNPTGVQTIFAMDGISFKRQGLDYYGQVNGATVGTLTTTEWAGTGLMFQKVNDVFSFWTSNDGGTSWTQQGSDVTAAGLGDAWGSTHLFIKPGGGETYTGYADAFAVRSVTLPPASDITVAAPVSGSSLATFTVALSASSSTPVSMDYATADGTALAGTDYGATAGTLTFAPGETTKTVVVPIFGNTVAQPDKTFSLVFSNPNGVVPSHFSARCTIATSHITPATNLVAFSKGISGIDLAWSEPAFLPNGYMLERSTNGGAYETIARIPAGTSTWQDADVKQGVTYRYRLVAYNAVVSASTGAVEATSISGPNAFPASAFLNTRDYGTMWWRAGVRGERVWQIQTSRYAMTFECDSLNLSTIFPLSSYLPETTALIQPNEQSFPASSLALNLTASGSSFGIGAYSTNNDDAHLLESGKYFQRRWQKIKTTSGPALNATQSGLEVCAWPDRVSIICRAVPTDEITAGGLHMTLTFGDIYKILSSSGAAKALAAADGSGFIVLKSAGSDTITVDSANARVTVDTNGGTWAANQERSVGLVIYPSTNVAATLPQAERIENAPLAVTANQTAPVPAALTANYVRDQGYFQIPLRNDAVGSDENRVERNQIVVSNTTSSPQLARFAFTKGAFPYEAGYSCLLRDMDGNPLGLPVQLSKNWHTGSGERWQGPWFHGLAMFTVPANTTLRFEAFLVGQNYGGVPAASHSQLSLVGWGANQQWEEAAIGCWGESLCYEPDSDQAAAIGTDSRPLLLLSNTGMQKQWTGNYGGCDFLRYYDGANTRRFQKRIRTWYQRYGPNLTNATYAGLTDDSKIEFQYSASLYRSNDYTRGHHRIRYDVKSDAAFTRMVFFQLASDNYNYNGGTTNAYGYGDQLTHTAQWTTTDITTPVALTGPLPWFSTLSCPVDPSVPSQTGATRGFVVRSWKARINGQDNVSPRFVSSGSRFDLVPPQGVTTLKAGDYVEAEIERFYFGQAASAYYGGDANLTTAMQSYGNSHQMALREVIGNNLSVTVTNGTLEKSYPIQVRAANNSAQFSVTRGIGYVPVTFTGLTDYRKPLLEELAGANWVAVNQATVGKDFWQADYEPASASWQITFNVKLDAAYQDLAGLRDAPATRTFRFRQEGAPSATASVSGASIPVVPSQVSITLSAGDTPVSGLTLSAVSSDTALIPNADIHFSGSGFNRTLTYTAAGGKGSATITIYATDAEGKTGVLSLPVTVDAYQAWNQEFFAGTSDPDVIGDTLDPDGDGNTNLQEYAAGTNPLDPADHFTASIDQTANGVDIVASGRAGRAYVLERSTTLDPGSWQEIARTGTLAADQPPLCNDQAPPTPRSFYRMTAIAP